MTDDFVVGGILPLDGTASDDTEFDPDAFESDDILDDVDNTLLKNDDASEAGDDAEEDNPLEEGV